LEKIRAVSVGGRPLRSGRLHFRDFAISPGRCWLSARNQIKGKVVSVQRGETTGHVRIDVGNGIIITSSITNEAIDELGLAVGDDAIAIIKASDVMVAK
jgi:molybdopterin-binding protein